MVWYQDSKIVKLANAECRELWEDHDSHNYFFNNQRARNHFHSCSMAFPQGTNVQMPEYVTFNGALKSHTFPNVFADGKSKDRS